MPYDINWEKRGFYIQFKGIVTVADVENIYKKLYSNPQFDDARYFIWDASEAEDMLLTMEDVELPASMDMSASKYSSYAKVALVSKKTNIQQIMQHYMQSSILFGSKWSYQFFDDVENARQWVA